MRGHTIDRAKKEDRIVGIDRVMPKMEKPDLDPFGQEEQSGHKCFDFIGVVALF
jgi:hypothetical protein